jgi:protein involved in ribonucleotide reduction
MAIVSIFFLTVALIAGMVGCGGASYALIIASTAGGNVTTPGEGMFTYDEGTVVNLTAEAEEGYHFVNWTGNVSNIANVTAASTNITMDGDYFITANFAEDVLAVNWTRQFGTSSDDYSYGIAVDSSGNAYVVGYTWGSLPGQTSSGRIDVFVRKYDTSGNELWTRQFGTAGDQSADGVSVDSYGNVYVAGGTYDSLPGQTSSGDRDAFVRKYDSSGNELWTRQFGSTGDDYAQSVATDSFGNVLVAGWTTGTLPGQTSLGSWDVFVRKYDSSGNEQWTRQFGTTSEDVALGVAVDSSGNAYVVGRTWGSLPGQTSSGRIDVFVRKYDTSGNEQWTRQFGTGGDQEAHGVSVDSYGNVYVAGGTYDSLPGQTSSGDRDAFVRKYDSLGNELWTRQFGSTGNDYASSIAISSSGNVLVVGFANGSLPGQTSLGSWDVFVRKYDSSGNEQWTHQFGTSGEDVAIGVATSISGSAYVAGWTTGTLPGQTSPGGFDAFVLKE